MNDISLIAAFGDLDKKVSLSQPNGAGGAYFITVDDLHCGTITKIRGQWVAHLNALSESCFTFDDICILGDIIDDHEQSRDNYLMI